MFIVSKLIPAFLRPHNLADRRYRALCGGRVFSGPFKGMKYISQSACSALAPKLIGCYERELWEIIELIIKRSPSTIIDIGAAEGFYAVGLALRCPTAHVVAFEMEDSARELLRELATLNDVTERVEIMGTCTPELLSERASAGACLLICDAEGAESHLLDPARIPGLKDAEILVEVHEFAVAGITEILLGRFRETHSAAQIWAAERTSCDLPVELRSRLLNRWMTRIIAEERPCRMSWLHLVPQNAAD